MCSPIIFICTSHIFYNAKINTCIHIGATFLQALGATLKIPIWIYKISITHSIVDFDYFFLNIVMAPNLMEEIAKKPLDS